jgi:hypothetical protein
MTPTLTKAVEAGARALAHSSLFTPYDLANAERQEELRRYVRATLRAALPVIAEDIRSTVQGDFDEGHRPASPYEEGYCEAVIDMRVRTSAKLAEIMGEV